MDITVSVHSILVHSVVVHCEASMLRTTRKEHFCSRKIQHLKSALLYERKYLSPEIYGYITAPLKTNIYCVHL